MTVSRIAHSTLSRYSFAIGTGSSVPVVHACSVCVSSEAALV